MIRVFPRRTKWTPVDDLAFIGNPGLFRPPEQPVKISVTFTWHIEEAEHLKKAWKNYYSDVEIGGPAYGDPGGEFEPGRFIMDGVTITSRGCPKNCSWCHVPNREGEIRELEIKPGWIVQDNNLLACSGRHVINVFDMLRKQNRGIEFSGGLDMDYLSEWHIGLLKSIKVNKIWFACDSKNKIKNFITKAEMLKDFPQDKKRCYVMIGYNGETIQDAEERLKIIYNAGFLPFCQLYQGIEKTEYSRQWKDLCRVWSRPAIYKGVMAVNEKSKI